jgi:hypothetical protein
MTAAYPFFESDPQEQRPEFVERDIIVGITQQHPLQQFVLSSHGPILGIGFVVIEVRVGSAAFGVQSRSGAGITAMPGAHSSANPG